MHLRAPRFTLFPYTTLFRSHLRDDLLNAVVGAAAAKISAKAAPNVFGRGLRVLVKKSFAGDNESGSAEAALGSVDRKSTRLNSSHRCISYAVFCLKKKKSRLIMFPHFSDASARTEIYTLSLHDALPISSAR